MTTNKTRRTRTYTITHRCNAPTQRHGHPCMRPVVHPEARCSEHFNMDPAPPAATVDHPKHYNHGTIEAITVIEDWQLNFNLGNAVKYIGRADHKGNPVQDLSKAIWYLQREITRRQA